VALQAASWHSGIPGIGRVLAWVAEAVLAPYHRQQHKQNEPSHHILLDAIAAIRTTPINDRPMTATSSATKMAWTTSLRRATFSSFLQLLGLALPALPRLELQPILPQARAALVDHQNLEVFLLLAQLLQRPELLAVVPLLRWRALRSRSSGQSIRRALSLPPGCRHRC
jgi:hypothetical protein